ncbi:MAG: TonB-dependent receptor [Acidobacteriota bacterium]
MRKLLIVLSAALLLAASSASSWAQAIAEPPDLTRFSIEDLLSMEITSAGKKQQHAEDVAAAITVITQDDIRRSGLRTLPELFRLVPGMEVAQINSNKWAVSARGFNDLFSNKLLVLIDGRSIYNTVFSGVLWDGEDLLLQDIERIEVIRGAGGTAWGANAMNGVINIISKSAAETKGTAVALSAGTFERDQASVRHGGSLGGLDYRVFSQWSDHRDSLDQQGRSADDRWNSLTNGVRADWSRGSNALMAEANFSTSKSRPHWNELLSPFPALAPSSAGVSDVQSGTVTGRWVHTRPDGSMFQVQAFKTTRVRDERTLWSTESIDDVDLQYHRSLGAHHDLVAGGGYRANDLRSRGTFTLDIPSDKATVVNTFAQDEISLGRRVKVTLGSKLEHDSLVGWGVLPSARIMWNVTPTTQRAWAAVSRARRTPSLGEQDMRIYFAAIPGNAGVPLVFGLVGNPDVQAERLTDVEGGYRFQIGSTAAVDVAVFRGSYDHLSTQEPIAPSFKLLPEPHLFVPVQYQNLLSATTSGVEIAGHWAPAAWWRLDGSYSGFHVTPHADAASQDPAALASDANAPQHQWQLHGSLWPTPRMQFDASVYHVGPLRVMGAEAYTRADARVEFKISHRLSAIATGQNLFDPAHAEYTSSVTPVAHTAIPRGGNVSLSWKF